MTPVINSSAAVTATGNAAMSMPTSVLSANAGQGKPGKLCIKVYSATLNTTTNVVASSTLLGSYSYQLPDWPDANELISFPFRYLATGSTSSLAAGARLMAELTVDNASSFAGMALVYGTTRTTPLRSSWRRSDEHQASEHAGRGRLLDVHRRDGDDGPADDRRGAVRRRAPVVDRRQSG